MKFKKIIFVLMGIILLLPQIAYADGGIFPPSNKYLTETDQKAVIVHENGLETLILSTTFKGEPEDFGWVIPVPAKPEVEKSQDELFTSLAELTAPSKSKDWSSPTFGSLSSETRESLNVDIIETEKIDIYNITTVTSEDPKDLAEWLSKNEYQIPKTATTFFEDYTKNNWYFICIKVDLAKLTKSKEDQLKSGHATPLKIQFESSEIIYPLKLSSTISEYESLSPNSTTPVSGLTPLPQVSVLIYVLSDGKKTVPGFDIEYANWVRKDDIEALAINPSGENWYKTKASKLYLTKAYKMMKTNEMTDDLVFRPASNNETVGVVQSSLVINILLAVIIFALIFIVILLSPVGLTFIILSVIQFLVKSKAARIICWILQILVVLLTILAALIISLYAIKTSFPQYSSESAGYSVDFDWSNIAAIVAAFAVVVVEIMILIWQAKFQKKHCVKKDENNPQDTAENMFDPGSQEKNQDQKSQDQENQENQENEQPN